MFTILRIIKSYDKHLFLGYRGRRGLHLSSQCDVIYCEDNVEEILLFDNFFPIVDTCLSCEDIADNIVRWCADGDFFLRNFCVLFFQ